MTDQPSLLHLPYEVRRKIYVELFIIRQEPVCLYNYPPLGEWSCLEQKIVRPKQGWPESAWFTNQLFYVSPAISEDVRTAFYSENQFSFACHIGSWKLEKLQCLSPLVWRSFRRLSFALDQTYHRGSVSYVRIKYDDWFRARAQDVSKALADWRYICDQLATYTTEDRLDLRFMCDATTKETATAFLAPLERLPRLKELCIQIGPFFNPEMDAMAEAVIRQKTKSKKSPGVFRFFDLPVELQYRVLEYTNLVLDRRFSYDCLRGTFIPPFICDTYSRNPRKDFCTGRAAIPCLRTPHMLFLVNNAMRQLATAVFYSRNSFKIKPRLRECAPAAAWSAEQSEFIQGFPKRSFPYLRHIRWKFDNNFSGNWAYFLPGSKEVEDWVISLYLISLVVPPGVLKIEITMYSFGCSNLTAETQRHEDNDGAYYDRVIGPMDCLKGRLKDLFIQISYPRCSPWDEIRRDRERQLERRIMGSDYDSFARGKKLNDEEAWWCDFGLT